MSLFSEDKGQASLMRVITFITVMVALGIGVAALILSYYKGNGDIGSNTMALVLGLIGGAFAGKVTQKVFEDKSGQ